MNTATIKKLREQQEKTDSKALHALLQQKIDAITKVLPESFTITREQFEQELWDCWESSKHHHFGNGNDKRYPNFLGWLEQRNELEANKN